MSAAPHFNDVSLQAAARALAVFRRDAIAHMTAEGAVALPVLTRLGTIFPDLVCADPAIDVRVYSVPDGLHFLKVTLAALAAAGRRGSAIGALHNLAGNLIDQSCEGAESFIEDTLAPFLRTETAIPVDFTQDVLALLRARVAHHRPAPASAAMAVAMTPA